MISIHAPARGATCNFSCHIANFFYFNPRSREGSDNWLRHFVVGSSEFQSTLPRGERPEYLFFFIQIAQHFNPRSREGSDEISTPSFLRCLDFNPRSREGSDFHVGIWCIISKHFNPRSREGSDARWNYSVRCKGISIHAPARGATQFSHLFCRALQISIHAPARGATIGKDQNLSEKKFQSTLPRGERREGQLYFIGIYNFNPRSREGSDIISQ